MEINPLANIMAYTVVMDVLVFSKEVFENVSSIPVFVSSMYYYYPALIVDGYFWWDIPTYYMLKL